MNQKVKTGALSVVTVVALLCLFRFTFAYFVDRETAVNQIKIGRISVELDEGDYTPPENTLPSRIFDKAPKLKNTGTKDEFVFLEVTVPKESVTLLYEPENVEGKEIGEIRKPKNTFEIFRMIAENSEEHPVTKLENPFGSDFDTDFSYHANEDNKDGWIFLESSSTDESNSYVFAYNRKLSPEEETATLFDKVQLKSFINGEVTGEQTISVQPYAIQSEKLTADGLTDDCKNNEIATKNDLQIIYNVIQRKVAKS